MTTQAIELAPPAALVAPVPQSSLLRERDYVSVLVGQGISALGSAMTMVALPLMVLLLTGSGLLMGVVGILETVPDLFIGLPAGVYADRWDRRRVMIFSDAGRALLTALIPLAVVFGLPVIPVVLIVVGPINILRVLFSAAENASIPALAGRDRLAAAAGYIEAMYALGYVIGPALAGLLIVLIGPGPTIAFDALSFGISAFSVWLVRRPLVPPAGATQKRVVEEMREGLAYVWSHRPLRNAIAFYVCLALAMAPFVPAFTYFLVRERGMDSGGLGVMVSVFSVGMLLGALAATRLKAGRIGLRMIAGTLVLGAGLMVGRMVPSTFALGLLGLVVGSSYTLVEVAYVTLRLAASPDALLGRVTTVAKTVSVGAQPLGMLAGGLLIDRVGGGATLAAMGAAAFAIAVGFGMSRALRPARADGGGRP